MTTALVEAYWRPLLTGRRQQESSGVYLDQEDSLFGAQPLPPTTTTTTTPPELAYGRDMRFWG